MIGFNHTEQPRDLSYGLINDLVVMTDRAAWYGHPASRLKQGVLSVGQIAVAGVDGYLFIADGSNSWERQYIVGCDDDSSRYSRWLDVFESRQAIARDVGAELYNLVIPEKQAILPEKRWPKEAPRGDSRPIRRLQEIVPPSCRLIYPEKELIELSRSAPTYLRHDSHWTALGCLTAMARLTDAMGLSFDLRDFSFPVVQRRFVCDLTALYLDPGAPEQIVSICPTGRLISFDNKKDTVGRFNGSTYTFHNQAAHDERSVIIFGDSYSFLGGVSYVLMRIFREVVFVWSKDIDWDLVREKSAQIVIWELAERFLPDPPQA